MIEAYEKQYGPCDRVEETALFFAWAARGEYERGRQRELLGEIRACLDCLYTDRTYGVSRLAPGTLTAHAGPISIIDRLVNAALAEPAPDGGQE